MIKKVLLVDDDPDLRLVGELALAEVGGWSVVIADSGFAALELAVSEQPDLIVLDVMMPELDGLGTLAKLRESAASEIPVIFMTARVQVHQIEEYVAAGAIGVISKPFDPMTLPDEIRAIAEK